MHLFFIIKENNQNVINLQSLILRDLSNQFLSEVSKLMKTINYIPGDSIIKRKSNKSSIIYISYGDVEVRYKLVY